jgi:cysteine-rich repeat protein
MSTACGDGWADTDAGEVCDDGEALVGGGCAANCKAVNPGWRCGAFANGCEAEAAEDGGPDAEPGPERVEISPEAAEGGAQADDISRDPSDGGCGGAGRPSAWWALAALRFARRTRQVEGRPGAARNFPA